MAEPKSPRKEPGVLTRTKSEIMRRASIVHGSVGNLNVINTHKDKPEKDIYGKQFLKAIYKNKPLAELITNHKQYLENYTKNDYTFAFCECENYGDDIDVTPLYAACAWGRMERVKELLAAEVDMNKGKPCGHSPLYAVLFNNQRLDIAELLVSKGCDLTTKDAPRWINKTPRIRQKVEQRKRIEADSAAHRKEKEEWERRFAQLERRVKQLESLVSNLQAGGGGGSHGGGGDPRFTRSITQGAIARPLDLTLPNSARSTAREMLSPRLKPPSVLKQIKYALKRNNYGDLRIVLNEIPIEEIQSQMLSGTIPMGSWHALSMAAQEARQSLVKLTHAYDDLTAKINKRSRVTPKMRAKQALLQQQLEIGTQLSDLFEVLQPFAEIENTLIREFQQKTGANDWNPANMTMQDIAVALQLFDLPRLISQVSNLGLSPQAILEMDLAKTKDIKLGRTEKLNLVYVVTLIHAKIFDLNLHKSKCKVCGHAGKARDLMLEYGVPSEMVDAIGLLHKLPARFLVVSDAKHLVPGSEDDVESLAQVSKALGKIRDIHLAACKKK